ncbi:MAG: hypothetical protein HC895_24275 [Leptolyngbyaceae cyanobacterium SM1_3_5]|nr:hypothetical protein [Leptolyngbyaceae cyanobacterium SM1_3_5]
MKKPKKTRSLESQGKGDGLNKSKIFISYRKEHQLEKVNGEGLKRAIEQYIPTGLEKYIEDKTKLLKTLGFEQVIALVTITFSADSMEKLVDSALGIGEAVSIEKSVGYNSRFGILLSEPFVKSDEALISLQAKPVKAVLRFKEYTFSPGIAFDAELLRSPFDQIFPEEFAKARVKSKFFYFIFQPKNKIKVSCHIESDGTKYPLDEIRNYLKVVSMLQGSSDSLVVEIEWGEKDIPMTCQFPLKGQLEDRQLAIAHQLSVTLSSLLPVFQLSENQFFLSFSELLSASGIIQTLHHYCFTENLTGEIIEVVGEVELANNRTAMIGFVQAEIGSYTFGICLGILGAITLVDEHKQSHALVAERCLVYAPFVAQENRAIEPAVIAEKLNQFAQRLRQEQFAVMTTAFA